MEQYTVILEYGLRKFNTLCCMSYENAEIYAKGCAMGHGFATGIACNYEIIECNW